MEKYFERVYTTPFVINEIKDSYSKLNLELSDEAGKVIVLEPELSYYELVEGKLRDIGETGLSKADKSVIALAIMLGNSVVFTDDLAVQNVLAHFGVDYYSVKLPFKLKAGKRVEYVCPSCGRAYKEPGVCKVCGTPLVRTVKRH